MKTSRSTPEVLKAIIALLEPLTDEARNNVLRASQAFFGKSTTSHLRDQEEDQDLRNPESFNSLGMAMQGKDGLRPGHKAAIVAYWLRRKKNKDVVSLNDLREAYDSIGLTPPDRFDMTIKSAVVKSNKLFTVKGRNQFSLTYHGQELGKAHLNSVSK